MPFTEVDVVFLCFGHGKSETFLREHSIPESVKIIDLAQDFRIAGEHDFVYGLPEVNRERIREARHVANPGCFATAIQLALLPALRHNILSGDIHVGGTTGSTGAGQRLSATTHFSWRVDNMSLYKPFTHQHLCEVNQTFRRVCPDYTGRVRFLPQRGCFPRGIFVTAYANCSATDEEVKRLYEEAYRDEPFTHFVSFLPSMKQAVNTNKAIVHATRIDDQLLAVCCIDNLLKGAVGQAIENMNLMFNLPETTGLLLKANAF